MNTWHSWVLLLRDATGDEREVVLGDCLRDATPWMMKVAAQVHAQFNRDSRWAHDAVSICFEVTRTVLLEAVDGRVGADEIPPLVRTRTRQEFSHFINSPASSVASGETGANRRRGKLALLRRDLEASLERAATNDELLEYANKEMARRHRNPSKSGMVFTAEDLAPRVAQVSHDAQQDSPSDVDESVGVLSGVEARRLARLVLAVAQVRGGVHAEVASLVWAPVAQGQAPGPFMTQAQCAERLGMAVATVRAPHRWVTVTVPRAVAANQFGLGQGAIGEVEVPEDLVSACAEVVGDGSGWSPEQWAGALAQTAGLRGVDAGVAVATWSWLVASERELPNPPPGWMTGMPAAGRARSALWQAEADPTLFRPLPGMLAVDIVCASPAHGRSRRFDPDGSVVEVGIVLCDRSGAEVERFGTLLRPNRATLQRMAADGDPRAAHITPETRSWSDVAAWLEARAQKFPLLVNGQLNFTRWMELENSRLHRRGPSQRLVVGDVAAMATRTHPRMYGAPVAALAEFAGVVPDIARAATQNALVSARVMSLAAVLMRQRTQSAFLDASLR